MKFKLNVTPPRQVTVDELDDLIHGTGVLTWEWWHFVSKATLTNEEGEAVDGYEFRHEGADADDVRTFVPYQKLVDAAARTLAEGYGGEDAREAIHDNLGYLDAAAADIALQYAVFDDIIFG